MRKLVATFVVLTVVVIPLIAQDKDAKKDLQAKLSEIYQPSKMGSFGILKERGTALNIEVPGIQAHDGSTPFGLTAKVRDGKINNGASYAGEHDHLLKVGDKVYVKGVDVADDHVDFSLVTDPIEQRIKGKTSSTSFTAKVSFQFEKGFLGSADLKELQKTFAQILSTDDQTATANTKTIELGQTITQVEKILGKPENVAKLGAKTIYSYKTMKVIFMDGKVTDVQ